MRCINQAPTHTCHPVRGSTFVMREQGEVLSEQIRPVGLKEGIQRYSAKPNESLSLCTGRSQSARASSPARQ